MSLLDGLFGPQQPAQPGTGEGLLGRIDPALMNNHNAMIGMGMGLLSGNRATAWQNALQGYLLGANTDYRRARDRKEDDEKTRTRALQQAAAAALGKAYSGDPVMAPLAAAYPEALAGAYVKSKTSGPELTDELREYTFARKQHDAASPGQPFPTFTDWKANLRKAGATTIALDQKAETGFETDYGKGLAKDALGVVEAGRKATANLGELTRFEQTLRAAETGKLAAAGMTVGAYARSLGVPDETLTKLGFDPQKTINREAVLALAGRQLINQIGAGGFPAQGFSNADREFLERTVPGLNDTPEANSIKLEVIRRANQRQREMSDAWLTARDLGVPYEKFLRQWSEKVSREPAFADLAQRAAPFAGQGSPLLPPVPGDGGAPVRNAPGTGPSRIRVDGQGRIVP